MGSSFTCKLNPCCGDRRNCDPPPQYSDRYRDEPVAPASVASPAVAPVAQSETADLIKRLRGPVFGTQTALDAATAIETWKARAERLADMHRDMCVVAGEAVARAEKAEAALANR